MKEYFEHILNRILDPNNKSKEMSMNHVHARDMFSLVVDGSEPGKLTRIFIAGNDLNPFDVQYHTHRYPIKLTTIKGDITHHIAEVCDRGLNISGYNYRSFLNGGSGLEYIGEVKIKCHDYKLSPASQIIMSEHDFHTMSCSAGSMWIVEELGFKTDESQVLGVPFVTDLLYQQPAMFQINDVCQVVAMELKKIIEAYKLV